ncbi:MAG: TonB-dependent receptor [Bacteroidales bacterium]|nr:TonB-dependent receptor [Bacteroidales bacterium]
MFSRRQVRNAGAGRRVLSLTLAAFFASGLASAQEKKTVTGQVFDNVGSPIPGAAVMVKGTTVGTVTDMDGKFSIEAPSDGVLEVSFIGYTTETMEINGQDNIEFVIFDELNELDELMVIGYGTQKKSDLTGAITAIKSSDIVINPGSNPMEALQGKVAGLDILKSSGQAGSGVNMQLRGTRSFTASGNPTFIIDGMPGDYSTLNPNDIESIEVLKDASSTAVYGASGANGVILITTKSGKEGRLLVNVNAYAGFNGWGKTPEMRTGDSYLQGIRDAQKAAGKYDSYKSEEEMFNAVLGDGAWDLHKAGKYIDWADELLRTATVQNYSISVSRGSENSKTYFSLNYSDERGQYENDNNKVYSSSFRIDQTVREWLSLGVNSQLSYVYGNRAYADLETALTMQPLGELYNEDGTYKVSPTIQGGNFNMLLNNHSNYRNNRQNFSLRLTPYFEIRPIEGLSWLSRIQANLSVDRSNVFVGMGSYQYYRASGEKAVGTNSNVEASITTNRGYNYKWENVLTYDFKIADDNHFTVTAVSSWNHNQSDNSVQRENNIKDNAYFWHNMGAGDASNSTVSSKYEMSKGLGFVGRINYGYAGKYLASVSVRHDGSSRLAKDYRWDTFPAFSLGWRISEEDFMEPTLDVIDNLKLRFGYGVTGTAGISPYSTMSKLEANSLSFSGHNVDIYRFGEEVTNEGLGWEKSHNANIGLDVSVLRGMFDLAFDLYKTRTDGVIWTRKMPITDGGLSSTQQYKMAQNICETENRGIEIQLVSNNIRKDDLEWKSTVTFSANKEEITKLTGGAADNISNGDYALTIGEPVNSYYHYKVTGVWQKDEAEDAAAFGCKPGDLKAATKGLTRTSAGVYTSKDEKTGETVTYDKTNPYTYSDKDFQTLGHNNPDWTLGFKNEVNWKGFDLSVFMFWRWGQTIKYNLLTDYDPTGVGNFPKYFNYWTEENPSNDFPALNANNTRSSYKPFYGLAFVDGSYFKLKNITLGYSLPKEMTEKLKIEKLRIYGTITNPLVHAKSDMLEDYDPEQNGSINYPLTKQLVFGVNLTF